MDLSRDDETGHWISQEGPINTIKVLSTGWAEQHAEHRYGSWLPTLVWIFFRRNWVSLPIQLFVIEHREGLVLFDTGLDPAIATDKTYVSQAIGRFLLPWIFRLHISKENRLDHELARAGYAAKDVKTAVISHLHFDHIGGIACIPQAELLVSNREWDILSEPSPERDWILREHIEIPRACWIRYSFTPTTDPLFSDFVGVHDVAGDGSMVLLPTPGHTPGSVSMLIRQDGWKPILLVGDLTYEAALLEDDILPAIGDKKLLKESYRKVRCLKEKLPGLEIVASHDFGASKAVGRAIDA